MSLADVARVHEIDKLSFNLSWSERSYRFEITENQNSINLVAEVSESGDQSSVIGMIVLWVILDEAHIATIAVHPDYRGCGIGKKLLANGLAAAYNRGARLAYLEVRKGNLTAQNLYDKFEFKVVGNRPRYYKDNNEDALLMTLDNLQIEQLHILTR
ncbi:MAG: ribosomal protein S18-alanine N-acetyltransferase [Anaerolineaceae bacterium]|nr:ribosomal protein S18-alanine N-acetyltransferase [Anaerolineaceae bacterium]